MDNLSENHRQLQITNESSTVIIEKESWVCEPYPIYIAFFCGVLITTLITCLIQFVVGEGDGELKEALEKVLTAGLEDVKDNNNNVNNSNDNNNNNEGRGAYTFNPPSQVRSRDRTFTQPSMNIVFRQPHKATKHGAHQSRSFSISFHSNHLPHSTSDLLRPTSAQGYNKKVTFDMEETKKRKNARKKRKSSYGNINRLKSQRSNNSVIYSSSDNNNNSNSKGKNARESVELEYEQKNDKIVEPIDAYLAAQYKRESNLFAIPSSREVDKKMRTDGQSVFLYGDPRMDEFNPEAIMDNLVGSPKKTPPTIQGNSINIEITNYKPNEPSVTNNNNNNNNISNSNNHNKNNSKSDSNDDTDASNGDLSPNIGIINDDREARLSMYASSATITYNNLDSDPKGNIVIDDDNVIDSKHFQLKPTSPIMSSDEELELKEYKSPKTKYKINPKITLEQALSIQSEMSDLSNKHGNNNNIVSDDDDYDDDADIDYESKRDNLSVNDTHGNRENNQTFIERIPYNIDDDNE